jgi:hypothetical protein
MDSQATRQNFRIAREGKGWIAVAPGFRNLEASPFGYDLYADGAIAALLADPDYQMLAERRNWRTPTAADFIEIDLLEEDEPAEAQRPVLRLVSSR